MCFACDPPCNRCHKAGWSEGFETPQYTYICPDCNSEVDEKRIPRWYCKNCRCWVVVEDQYEFMSRYKPNKMITAGGCPTCHTRLYD